jgi:phage terminase large subunit GpA-like protein
MDCLGATSPVREIVIMKSNQVGVTEAMVNAIGYVMDHAPGPMMVLMPTLTDRDAWKAQKLNPLMQETPRVRDLLGGLRSRDAANRQDLIDFPGGVLFLSGGNSPNSYAQRSARLVLMDDLERFPVEVGDEGDPVALAKGRVKAFPHKYKLLLASTPTVKEASIIDREYQASDRRRYLVPCPHCAELQPLTWDNIKYDRLNNPPQTAWYECGKCGEPIDETHKPALLSGGRWVAQRPEVKRRGYHINALYAPIGLGPSWLDLAREWAALHRTAEGQTRKADPGKLKAFLNLHLGLPWEDRTGAVKTHHLKQREEETEQGAIPPGILALTVGIDTQDTWLDITLLGWRPWQDDGQAGWMPIDWHQIHGDTSRPEPWNELQRWLNTERRNAYGQHMRIHAAGIDNRGHRGEQVRAFCQREELRVPVYRVQGSTRRQTEIIASTAREPERDYRGRARLGAYGLWNVGTETAKDLIYAALASDAEQPPEERRIRFPAGLPNEYYAGLLAEVYNPETRRYEQRRGAEYQRNEPLDGMVYAIAIGHHKDVMIALRRSRIYREHGPSQIMTVPDPAWWRRMAKVLEPKEEKTTTPQPIAKTEAKPTTPETKPNTRQRVDSFSKPGWGL